MTQAASGSSDPSAPARQGYSAPRGVASSRWQIGRALALVSLLAAWNAVSDLLSERFDLGLAHLASPLGWGFTLLGLLVTLGGIIGIGCVRWGKASLRELGWRAPELPRLVALGLLQTALLVALVFGVYAALAGLAGMRGLAAAIAAIPLGERIFFLVAGAKVAFIEETLFRGDLSRTLAAHMPVAASLVLSSAVFALYHRTLAPVPLGMKWVLGLIFGAFTLRSRSLVPSAIGHTLLWTIVGNN